MSMEICTSQRRKCKLEADIFSGIPRVMGNKITIIHVIGTGWEKMSAGVGGTRNHNNTMIPNFIHKYTFYINKLYILNLNSILVLWSPPVCFGVAG